MIDVAKLSGQFLKPVQRAVGVDADGVYGPKTAAAVDAFVGPLPLPELGVDVSHWQGDLPQSWFDARAVEGVVLCGVKLSQGVSGRDPQGSTHLARARAAGMKTLAYHFVKPKCDQGNAQANAQNFLAAIKANAGNVDLLALDFESKGDYLTSLPGWIAACFAALDAGSGMDPAMLYCGAEFYRLCHETTRPLWWAAYHGGFDPRAPRDVAIWQNSTARIDGKPIDHDYVAQGFLA